MLCIRLLGRFDIFPCKKLFTGEKLVKFALPRTSQVLHYCINMKIKDGDLLAPPKDLHGMKILNKDAFKKTVKVPFLIVKKQNASVVQSLLKNDLLKLRAVKSITEFDKDKQKFLLNPNTISSWKDFDEKVVVEFKNINISEDDFSEEELELGYDNWNANTLIEAVLPKDEPPLKSFSIIGHIIHLNIKNHLLDYKNTIGEILYDKTTGIRTVVYKKQMINNVYRNFEMELLKGEPDYLVSVKEQKCVYEFDFSKVYWNPRLSTEHTRIVSMVNQRDVLFDVFAGVGPFAIPAAKKMCSVFANDLNPESVKWLEHNIRLNKKSKDFIKVFNKDGGDFIKTDAKENLINIWQNEYFDNCIYFVMNLPAIAPTFVKNFKGLITKDDISSLDLEKVKRFLPIIHCYFFVRDENEKGTFEQDSGISLDDFEHSFHFVRKVSSSASMFRVTFTLTIDYLLAENAIVNDGEPLPKRICLTE